MVSKAKQTKIHVRRMSEGTSNGVVSHMTQDGSGRASRNYEPAIILPVAHGRIRRSVSTSALHNQIQGSIYLT